jgi:bifunctional DNA-binding transcriptional regulator/antitoxin component of YhaV-PrlF toxin-antitoxin module
VGYVTKVQVIQRANDTRQFYLICPAPLAQALGMEKGEPIEWEVGDRDTLIIRRTVKPKRRRKRASHGR